MEALYPMNVNEVSDRLIRLIFYAHLAQLYFTESFYSALPSGNCIKIFKTVIVNQAVLHIPASRYTLIKLQLFDGHLVEPARFEMFILPLYSWNGTESSYFRSHNGSTD